MTTPNVQARLLAPFLLLATVLALSGCCGLPDRRHDLPDLTAGRLEADLVGRFASTGRSTWEFETAEERRFQVIDARRIGPTFVAFIDVDTATVDGTQTATGRLRLTYEWVGGAARAWNLVRIESVTFRRTDGNPRGCCGG
jgi:hypothetical protein